MGIKCDVMLENLLQVAYACASLVVLLGFLCLGVKRRHRTEEGTVVVCLFVRACVYGCVIKGRF